MRLLQRCKSYYLYDMRLEHKLWLSHLTLSVLTVLLLTTLLYTNSARILEHKLLSFAESTSEKIMLSTENIIQKYDNMTYTFSMMPIVTDIFSHVGPDYDYAQIYKDRAEFENAVFTCIPSQIRNTIPECDIRVFFDDSFPYFNDPYHYATYSSARSEEWFQRVFTGYRKDRSSFYVIAGSEISAPAKPVSFSLARVLPDKNYYPKPLAILRLDFPENYLSSAISPLNFGDAVTFLTASDTGRIVAMSDSSRKPLFKALSAAGTKNAQKEMPASSSWKKYRLEGEEYFVIRHAVSSYPLTLTTLLPSKSILSEYYRHRNFTLLAGAVLLLLCLFLSSFLSRTMAGRLTRLTARMNLIRRDELVPLPSSVTQGRDEIGELTRTYNYMIGAMRAMMEKEYELGLEARNAELKILQAQINPHFLYNILDMIHWFAEEGMLPQIEEAVTSLASFYRLGLSNGKEFITLREEIDHVRSYVSLQKLRYPDTLIYEEKLDETLLQCQIPKTTLQPLFENAITHGLQESDRTPGRLTLTLLSGKDGAITIHIEDDGAGMDPSRLNALNHAASSCSESAGQGFGVHNVASRLKLLYGVNYGVTYESEAGRGTKATVRIPRSRE